MTDWATRGECCGGRHDRKFRSISFSNKHRVRAALLVCTALSSGWSFAAFAQQPATPQQVAPAPAPAEQPPPAAQTPPAGSTDAAAFGADAARARNDSASARGRPAAAGCETRAACGRRAAGAAAGRDTAAAGSAAASDVDAGGSGRPGPRPGRRGDPKRDRDENRHADSRNAAVDFRRHRRPDQAAGRSDADRGAAIYAGTYDRPLRREFAVRHHQGSRLRGSALPRRPAPAGRCRDHVRDPSHRSVRAGAHRSSSRPIFGPVRPDAAGRPDQHDEQASDRRSAERSRRAARQLQPFAGYVRLQRPGRFPGRMALSAGRTGAAQRYATRFPAGQPILHRAELHVAKCQYPLDRPDQRPGLLGEGVPAVCSGTSGR